MKTMSIAVDVMTDNDDDMDDVIEILMEALYHAQAQRYPVKIATYSVVGLNENEL